jgi:hypothetical protein
VESIARYCIRNGAEAAKFYEAECYDVNNEKKILKCKGMQNQLCDFSFHLDTSGVLGSISEFELSYDHLVSFVVLFI